jgi:uncharacterized protein
MSLHRLYVHDSRPGHLNQLKGLEEAIENAQASGSVQWLHHSQYKLRHILLGQSPHLQPKPDVVIACGHGTHLAALRLAALHRAQSVVVMKPSWPLNGFDSIIMPAHDDTPTTSNTHVLLTHGALNTVSLKPYQPAAIGLIALGGISGHYGWSSEQVISDIVRIIAQNPGLEWSITDSRRTPPGMLDTLSAQLPESVRIQPYPEAEAGWLAHTMSQAQQIWITPDSVSMVYEALSSGASVGLLRLPDRANNRITRAIDHLVADSQVHYVSESGQICTPTNPLPRLLEAQRAAQWLLSRLST